MRLPPLPRLPRLRPPRTLALVLGVQAAALAGAALMGTLDAGVAVAAALLPLLFAPGEPPERAWHPGRDLLHAFAAGLLLAALCAAVWSPGLLHGGATTGSDLGEHLWMLHSLRNPGWQHFSTNRYPLPAILAQLCAWNGNPHDAWQAAAVVSMGVSAAGLWLWGRAVAGPAAGWAAALMVGALPDLVVTTRTISVYPELIAAWTLAAGLAATALRWPRPWTWLLAGLGCAAAFSADARGLIPGLLIGAVSVAAAVAGPGRWPRRLLGLALVLGPVYGSWLLHNRLPLEPRPLERLLATSVQVSYTRLGQTSDWGTGIGRGWVWGRSLPWEIPATLATIRESQAALNPAAAHGPEQRAAYAASVRPLLAPAAGLALMALAACGRWAPGARRPTPRWRACLALLPLASHLALGLSAARVEYNSRYFALAMPGLALLFGLGLTAPAGRRRPLAVALLPAVLILWALPGPLNVRAGWRDRGASQPELQACLAAARGETPAPAFAPQGPQSALYECVQAQRTPLGWGIRWPW